MQKQQKQSPIYKQISSQSDAAKCLSNKDRNILTQPQEPIILGASYELGH